MTQYYHRHTRCFANECDIWRAETPEQIAALKDAGYARITTRNTKKHLAWMRDENQSWPGIGSHRWHDVVHDDAYSARHFLAIIWREEA